MCVYGYCRISKKSMNIERQVRNISEAFPNAHIVKEAFTGTKIEGRKELDKLLKVLKSGDTVICDSASRMSRNAEEAINLYQELYEKGINLIFLKERHIDTEVYRKALNTQIQIKRIMIQTVHRKMSLKYYTTRVCSLMTSNTTA